MTVPNVLPMLTAITITQIYVPDQDQALDFYVGKLGFEVQADMNFGPMRWLTVNLPGQPDRAVLLEKPGPPSMSEETAAQVREAISKGAAGGLLFSASHNPVQDLYLRQVGAKENKSVGIASKALADPARGCRPQDA